MKRYLLSLILAMCVMTGMAQTTQTHTVQRGETIESVAQKYGITVDELKAANPNASNLFFVGMKLNIPASASQSVSEQVMPVKEEVNSKIENKEQDVERPIYTTTPNNVSFVSSDTEKDNLSICESTDENIFLFNPDYDYYGVHFGGQLKKLLYMGVDMYYCFKKHGGGLISFGGGLGQTFASKNFWVRGSIYPYIGAGMSYDYKKDKTKAEFTYGAHANLSMGFKLYSSKKDPDKSYYLVGGYMITAYEFETKGMFKNGMWMIGIASNL